jgi:hypothetical protein
MDVKTMSRNLIRFAMRTFALVAMALLLQACSTGGVNMGNLFKDDKPQVRTGPTSTTAAGTCPQSAAVLR